MISNKTAFRFVTLLITLCCAGCRESAVQGKYHNSSIAAVKDALSKGSAHGDASEERRGKQQESFLAAQNNASSKGERSFFMGNVSAKVRKANSLVVGPNHNGWLKGTQYYDEVKTFKKESDFHVYLALYKPLQQECVVKRQSTEIIKSINDSVHDELRVSKRILQHRLNDKHVVKIYVYFEEVEATIKKNYLYIIMEYLKAFPQIAPFYREEIMNPFLSQGDSMAQLLQRGKLQFYIVRHFARQIIAGVIALKKLGVQHDDIYPKNIVITTERDVALEKVNDIEYVNMHRIARAVLVDFGKVKIHNVPHSQDYMKERMSASLRSELGNLFFYMITGTISETILNCKKYKEMNQTSSVKQTLEEKDALDFACFVLGAAEAYPTLETVQKHAWLNWDDNEKDEKQL